MKFNAITSALLSTLVASANAYDLLKDFAGDLKIGVAANTMKFNNGNYNNALKAFNMMVAENGCKLSGIQQQKGNYNFNDCDNHYNKAKELGMEFRGHCLVWHAHMPGWFEGADANTLKNAIIDHVTKTLQHYEGKIKVWDVVNEAIDDNSSSNGFQMRNSFLRQKVPDFVDIAFQTARKVSPNTKLFYNDYNAEGQFPKSEAIYNFVADLKKRNIPIDGVGLQYHVSANQQPTYDQINNLIGRYCKLGLEVHITELDVKLQGNQNGQTQAYSNALKACLANSCCKAFLVWGVGDNDSWLGANEQALLFNGNYQPKPIYNTLLNVLKSGARPAGSGNNANNSGNAGGNVAGNVGANAGNVGNGNKTTKTIPSFATKTIPPGLAGNGKSSKTIPVVKTIPPGAGGNVTKTIPQFPTKALPRTKTIPDMSNITVPKTKTIPNKTTKTAPITKTIPGAAVAGNAAAATKTIPKIASKTLPNLTKTLPNLSKSKTLPNLTKTLPNVSGASKTIPKITKTLPNVSGASKTIPKITKTLPNVSGASKTIPKITKTLPNLSASKTIPKITSKTIPNISGASKTIPKITKTLPDVSGSSKTIPKIGSKTLPNTSKTIPKIGSKTLPNASKTIPKIGSKTLPNTSKTIPKPGASKTLPKTTKTIPSGNSSNDNGSCNCAAATVTVTVTVNSNPSSETSTNCVAKWGQCGGNGYGGPTCCQSGSKCQFFNEWYSQCI